MICSKLKANSPPRAIPSLFFFLTLANNPAPSLQRALQRGKDRLFTHWRRHFIQLGSRCNNGLPVAMERKVALSNLQLFVSFLGRAKWPQLAPKDLFWNGKMVATQHVKVLQRQADQVGDRVLRGLRKCFLTVRSVAASRCGSAGFCVRRVQRNDGAQERSRGCKERQAVMT